MPEMNPEPSSRLAAQAAAVSRQLSDAELAAVMLAAENPSVVSASDAFAAITRARSSGTEVGRVLADTAGTVPVLRAIADILGFVVVDLLDPDSGWVVDESVIDGLDVNQLTARSALPVRSPSGELFVACANPLASPDVVELVSDVTGTRARPAVGVREQIESRLVFLSAPTVEDVDVDSQSGSPTGPVSTGPVSPVVEWLDNMLARAHADRVSDIHMSFRGNRSLRMRWRIDGQLTEQPMPLRGREEEVVRSLLARCATIDPSDVRRPQDGAFAFAVAGGRRVDARLSMMPQIHGPLVVMRLLDPANVMRTLDKMGFSQQALDAMRRAIESPQGMVFVVGPTGSGKSTTLYGMLYEMDTDTRNVLTAEDPVEYRMNGIGQSEMRPGLTGERALTFDRALRGFLRLDPDVILIGEVRDMDTARVALHAALTGHLLLSTIHANSALGVFQRLQEIGVEPYLAAEAMSLAVSQRLLRKLHSCKLISEPTDSEREFLLLHGLKIPETVASPRPGGCATCKGTGFFGRIPVVEVLEPSRELRDLVTARASTTELAQAARLGGWMPILDDAWSHVEALTVPVTELVRCLDGMVE